MTASANKTTQSPSTSPERLPWETSENTEGSSTTTSNVSTPWSGRTLNITDQLIREYKAAYEAYKAAESRWSGAGRPWGQVCRGLAGTTQGQVEQDLQLTVSISKNQPPRLGRSAAFPTNCKHYTPRRKMTALQPPRSAKHSVPSGWIELHFLGDPAPQGSKVQTKWGGMKEVSKKIEPWRASVQYACEKQWFIPSSRSSGDEGYVCSTSSQGPLVYCEETGQLLPSAVHHQLGRIATSYCAVCWTR